MIKLSYSNTLNMTNWERLELRPLFQKLSEKAATWDPPSVLPLTQQLGKLTLAQLEKYNEGKFRADRNECRGFFESIEKFVKTGLPISLEHFQSLVDQYKDRITPYPHYSGIKINVPEDLENLDDVTVDEIPTDLEDEDEGDTGSTLKLM